MGDIDFHIEYSGQLNLSFNEVEFGVLRLDIKRRHFRIRWQTVTFSMNANIENDPLSQTISWEEIGFEMDRAMQVLPFSLFLEPKVLELETPA